MNLVGHIVRKDFRRLRWILVLWVVVLTTAGVMAYLQAQMDEENYRPFSVAALIFESVLGPLIAFGLVMGLLDDDPVADADAFWLTRPLSSGELLGAKALGLALLCLVPVVAGFPWWLGYGFGRAEIRAAIAEILRMQVLVALLAVPIAAISANGSKFVLNVILSVAAVTLAVAVFAGAKPARMPTFGDEVLQVRLAGTGWILASVVIVVGQFFIRNTRLSVILLLACLLACVGFARLGTLQAGPDAMPAWSVGDNSEMSLPAAKGSRSSRQGRTLTIEDTLLDYTGRFEVSISETAPSPSGDPARALLGGSAEAQVAPRETYALVHPKDGRSLPADVIRWGGELDVAAVRYTHATLRFKAQQLSAAWLAEANLVKKTEFKPPRP